MYPQQSETETGRLTSEHWRVASHQVGIAVPAQERVNAVLVPGFEEAACEHGVAELVGVWQILEHSFVVLAANLLTAVRVVLEVGGELNGTCVVVSEVDPEEFPDLIG